MKPFFKRFFLGLAHKEEKLTSPGLRIIMFLSLVEVKVKNLFLIVMKWKLFFKIFLATPILMDMHQPHKLSHWGHAETYGYERRDRLTCDFWIHSKRREPLNKYVFHISSPNCYGEIPLWLWVKSTIEWAPLKIKLNPRK